MMRTCVLCCAVAGLLGLAAGCDRLSSSSSKATATQRDEAVTAYKARLDELDKKVAELKDRAEKATGDDKAKLEAKLEGGDRQARGGGQEARRAQGGRGREARRGEEGRRRGAGRPQEGGGVTARGRRRGRAGGGRGPT